MQKKLFPTLILVIIVIFLAVKHHSSLAVSRIGVIAPLTGVVAFYGEDMRKGIESIAGKENDLIFEDDECDPKKAVSAFKKLTEMDKVKIIIGPACGSSQEALVPLVKQSDVVLLLPSAASSNLYDESGGRVYNMQSSLEDEASYLAEQIFNQDKKRIVLITYKNAYSQTTANAFRKRFKGEIVKELSFTDATDDIGSQIISLKQENLDAIVVTDISYFFSQGQAKLKQYGINTEVYSSYVVGLPIVHPLVLGVKYSFPSNVDDSKGAIFVLAREAYQLAKKSISVCRDDVVCLKKEITASESFDQNGVSKRGFVMKQIGE